MSVTGAVKGVNPGFLVLAFSTRTLKSSGVPGRRVQAWGFCVSMSPLACSTPAYSRMSGVLGRRAFSCGPPLLLFGELLSSQDLLVVKLSPLCWLAASGEREGLFEQRALGCFRFHASLVVLRVLPGVGAGSEARGEAAVVLAYEAQVTVSVLACLATLLSQYRRCCCFS